MHQSDRTSSPHPARSTLLAALLLTGVLASAGAASITILPLGDSITHGSFDPQTGSTHLSYRYWLWTGLRANGYDVDFVGSLSTPNFSIAFDNDNEGHAGYTSGEVLGSLPTWLAASDPPAIALVHIGTNDVIAGIPPSETVRNLSGIVSLLRARNPGVAVLIARLIPTSSEEVNRAIVVLNEEIGGLQSLDRPGSPVIVVDQFSGYDGVRDNRAGGVHPSESGEAKMAARWMEALVRLLPARTAPTVTPTTIAPTAAPGSPARPWTRSRSGMPGSLVPANPGDAAGTVAVTPTPDEGRSESSPPIAIRPFGHTIAGDRRSAFR